MAYSEKVIDHFENPRNVGSLDENDADVGIIQKDSWFSIQSDAWGRSLK